MSKHAMLLAGAALFMGAPALADVTAPQIWAEWQQMQATMGTQITAGSEDYTGGVLTLRDVTTDVTVQDARSVGRFEQVTLTEQGDGTVRITMSPTYAVTTSNEVLGEVVITGMTVTSDGLEIIASGDAATRLYTYAAASVGLTLTDDSAQSMALSITTGALAGQMELALDAAPVAFTSSGSLASLSGTLDIDAEAELTADVTFELNGLRSTSQGTYGGEGAEQSVVPFGLGTTILSTLTFESGTKVIEATSEGAPFTLAALLGPGETTLDVTSVGFGIESTAAQTGIRVQIGGIPFPLEASAGEITTGFTMPLRPTEAPADFGLTVALRDLVVSDLLWGLIDPGATLPRDPATIALSLSGGATLAADLTDQAAMRELRSSIGTLDTARIEELTVDVAGARLTGTGAASFTSQGGVPMPLGAVDLRLEGGLQLLERLVALGLIPQQQAMGFRMMTGMFTQPAGDDVLTSRIEFLEGGGISANGMQIQ